MEAPPPSALLHFVTPSVHSRGKQANAPGSTPEGKDDCSPVPGPSGLWSVLCAWDLGSVHRGLAHSWMVEKLVCSLSVSAHYPLPSPTLPCCNYSHHPMGPSCSGFLDIFPLASLLPVFYQSLVMMMMILIIIFTGSSLCIRNCAEHFRCVHH